MKLKSIITRAFIYGAALITFVTLLMIILDILVKGIPFLKPELFALEYTSDNVSMLPSIINTFLIVFIALLIVTPIGILSAIYLVEYAKPGNKIVKLVRITAETLSGIPSIVFGLFGMLFFVSFLGWRFSLLAGACTVAMMVLPIIMRSTEEALMAVPRSQREASFGLGAMKLRTIFRIVLPSAMPGVLAGIILSVGRIVGETAALIFTAGSAPRIPGSLFNSARTLSVHMYLLSTEGLHKDQAYATGVVLLVLVLVINGISSFLASKVGKENGNE